MEYDAASIDYEVASDSEDEYEVASDDDFEVASASDEESEDVVKNDTEPVETVEQVVEDEDLGEIIEEKIFEEVWVDDMGNELVTEVSNSDSDGDMSDGSSVGDYDPNRPIITNPADIPIYDDRSEQQPSKAYPKDAENTKKKSKSKKSKRKSGGSKSGLKKEKSPKSKTKSSASSTTDLSEKKEEKPSKKNNDSKKTEKKQRKRSVSVEEMELGTVISDDVGSQALAELSALEAELNRSISLFTMQHTPNPDALKEVLQNSTETFPVVASTDAPERPRMDRMQSMSDLELGTHRGRETKERRTRRRRSRSQIHLLEGEDEAASSKANDNQSIGSLDDITKQMSKMKPTWDKAPESPGASKPPSLSSVLDAETAKPKEEPSEKSGQTESLSLYSEILTPRREKASFVKAMPSPARLVRVASLSKLMSYSACDDDLLDDDELATSNRSLGKKSLSNFITKKSSYNTMEDEEEVFNSTPTSRRKRMMKMGGLFRHSARSLG
ncbi:MAG: hypothetical protein SGBAC_004455 [Bacillariaceae sp.]